MAYLSNSHRKFAAAAITASLVATAVVPAYAAPYTDVSNRYEVAVNYLVENQITNGITASDFGTSQTIKRSDVAVMMAKALKLNVSKAKDSGFTDVPKRAKVYVDALKEAGIINGKTAVSFASDQEITRGEAAIMLAKAYKLTGDPAKNNFTDVSARYTEAVSALVTNEITQGKTKTSFGTGQAITRGEFAIFLHKLSKLDDAVISEAIVKNEAELKAALENNAIKKIFLSESFKAASTVAVVRNVEIDLNGQTLTGDLSYDSLEKTVVLLSSSKAGGKLAGTLTVNTPNADFAVGENVEITGGAIIRNVKASTFYNRGVLHSVTINDNDGASFANVNKGIVLGNVDLDTAGKVSLIGNIDLVTVNQAAIVNIADQAAVKKMVVKVNGATVDSFKGKIDVIETPLGITVKDSYGKLVETKTENTGSPGIVTVANVKNLEQLEAALYTERIKTINLTQNIEGLTKQIILNRAVTINGKGFSLGFTDELNAAPVNERSGIVITADKVKISNLKIEMPSQSGWQETYALQIYNSKEIVLDNFTGIGADASILINGSAVKLTGTTTVKNNEFGGIEVSKGSEENLSNSELTVSGTMVNEQEATGKPTIWMVDGQGTVKGENVLSHTSSIIREGQTQYYLTKQPIDDFLAGLIQKYEDAQQAFVGHNYPLNALELPFLELRNEWDVLNEVLKGEDLSQSNQDSLATLETDLGTYIIDRFEDAAKLNVEEDYTEASFSKLKEALVTPAPENFTQAMMKAGKISEAISTLVFAGKLSLDQAMAQAGELVEADYTIDSFTGLQNAMDTGIPKTNAETVEKTQLINTAMSKMVFAGQADLDKEIQKAENLVETDYTSGSFDKVETALALPKPRSNAKVLEKTVQIKNALSQLIFAAQSDLDEAMTKAEAMAKVDYTPVSYGQLIAAMELAAPKSNQEAEAKKDALAAAITALVFESQQALDEAMNYAKSLETKDYTAESFAKLQRAMSLLDPTSNQLAKEKNEAIQQAAAGLVFKNQQDLDNAMADAEHYSSVDYTAASYNELKLAMELQKPASNIEVLNKIKAINNAIPNLVFVEQDNLDNIIMKATALTADDYTLGSYGELQAALKISTPISNAEVKEKTSQIAEAISKLVFADQGNLDATTATAIALNAVDYTPESYGELTAAVNLPTPQSNSEVKQKNEAINNAISELIFAGQAQLDVAENKAAQINKAHYSATSFKALEAALSLPETTNVEVQTKAAAISKALAALKFSVSGFIKIEDIRAGNINTAPADLIDLLPKKIQVKLADGTQRELEVKTWTDTDGYDHSAVGSYTFTAQWVEQEDIDLADQTFSIEMVVEALLSSISSKSISNFDYSTSQATSASLTSKPVTVGDFTGNPKSFVIVAGEHRIPVTISWKLSPDFTKGQSMGSVVESTIQDYFYQKQGVDGLYNRTLYSMGINDTFSINSFKTGSASSIRLEGADWSYFFEKDYSAGTDLDTSKNRSFTVNVGEKTANITLTGKYNGMVSLINTINNKLKSAGVSASAEVIDDSHFSIKSLTSGQEVKIGGQHKADFFLETEVN